MNIEHLIIARGSSVDSDSNSLSVFEFIEDLTIQSAPGPIAIPMQVIAVFKRTDEQGPIRAVFRLSIEAPNQSNVVEQEVPVNFESTHVRNRLRINAPLPVERAGIYWIKIQKVDEPGISRVVELNVSLVPILGKKGR